MPSRPIRLAFVATLALTPALTLSLTGCASTPRSTSLTVDDLSTTATELSAKLAASNFMHDRTAESPRMVITLSKVENLSNDLIPSGEQWYMMARLRDSFPIGELRMKRNLVFVIPAEHLQAGRDADNFPANFAGSRQPTHEMTATFRSARRASGLDRTEGYDCEFRITDLTTGELCFAETVGFKRIAHGRSYD
jgi:hypothetical protein